MKIIAAAAIAFIAAHGAARADSVCERSACVELRLRGTSESLDVFEPKFTSVRHVAGTSIRYSHVAGVIDRAYLIDVKNNKSGRIEACVAVDGRNVVDGKKFSDILQGWTDCYLVDANRSYSIKGWRTSANEVSQFVFSSQAESLAIQHWGDSPLNAGTVVVAFFNEKAKPRGEYSPRGGGGDARSMGPRDNGLGTDAGRTEESSVVDVDFDRESTPFSVTVLHYDTIAALIKLGVVPQSKDRDEGFGSYGHDNQFIQGIDRRKK